MASDSVLSVSELSDAYERGVDDRDDSLSLHANCLRAVEAAVVAALAVGLDECEAWRAVAVESNKSIDAYLRELLPSLPEHYGMPVDGIRMVFNATVAKYEAREASYRRLRGLEIDGLHLSQDDVHEIERLRRELGLA